jgi:hypothetical protein
MKQYLPSLAVVDGWQLCQDGRPAARRRPAAGRPAPGLAGALKRRPGALHFGAPSPPHPPAS